MKITFYFSTVVENVERSEIIRFLKTCDIKDLESLSDKELIAELNETDIDEFFANGDWLYPNCSYCEMEKK